MYSGAKAKDFKDAAEPAIEEVAEEIFDRENSYFKKVQKKDIGVGDVVAVRGKEATVVRKTSDGKFVTTEGTVAFKDIAGKRVPNWMDSKSNWKSEAQYNSARANMISGWKKAAGKILEKFKKTGEIPDWKNSGLETPRPGPAKVSGLRGWEDQQLRKLEKSIDAGKDLQGIVDDYFKDPKMAKKPVNDVVTTAYKLKIASELKAGKTPKEVIESVQKQAQALKSGKITKGSLTQLVYRVQKGTKPDRDVDLTPIGAQINQLLRTVKKRRQKEETVSNRKLNARIKKALQPSKDEYVSPAQMISTIERNLDSMTPVQAGIYKEQLDNVLERALGDKRALGVGTYTDPETGKTRKAPSISINRLVRTQARLQSKLESKAAPLSPLRKKTPEEIRTGLTLLGLSVPDSDAEAKAKFVDAMKRRHPTKKHKNRDFLVWGDSKDPSKKKTVLEHKIDLVNMGQSIKDVNNLAKRKKDFEAALEQFRPTKDKLKKEITTFIPPSLLPTTKSDLRDYYAAVEAAKLIRKGKSEEEANRIVEKMLELRDAKPVRKKESQVRESLKLLGIKPPKKFADAKKKYAEAMRDPFNEWFEKEMKKSQKEFKESQFLESQRRVAEVVKEKINPRGKVSIPKKQNILIGKIAARNAPKDMPFYLSELQKRVSSNDLALIAQVSGERPKSVDKKTWDSNKKLIQTFVRDRLNKTGVPYIPEFFSDQNRVLTQAVIENKFYSEEVKAEQAKDKLKQITGEILRDRLGIRRDIKTKKGAQTVVSRVLDESVNDYFDEISQETIKDAVAPSIFRADQLTQTLKK